VDVYQVWDEPNLKMHWGGMPQPPEYTALLCAAYDAIHAADPTDLNADPPITTTVLAAALAPTTEQGYDNLNEVAFLRGMYGHGAKDCFDGAAGKSFGFDPGSDDRRVEEDLLNFSRLILLREVMVANDDGDKPLWASAFGWNHLPDDWDGDISIWGATDAETQFRRTADAYARAREEWPWLGGLILYHWQPDAPEDDPRWGFAVVGQDGEPGPLLDAFSAEPEAAPPGRYRALNPYAEYTGEWDFTEFGADMGVGAGNSFTFTASGTDIALELRRYHYNAYFYVTVDGEPANALPIDPEGRAYIVLNAAHNDRHTTDLIAVARGLDPDTPHTVEVTGQASWGGQWVLGGFRVGSPPDLRGYDAALLALAVVGVVGLAGVWWQRATLARWLHSSLPVRLLARLPGLHFVAAAITSVLLFQGLAFTWGGVVPNTLRRVGEAPTVAAMALSAGVIYFSESLVLTWVFIAVLYFLVYQRINYGLALVLFWAPFYLTPVELYYDKYFSMAEVVLLVTAAAWLSRELAAWAKAGLPLRLSERRFAPRPMDRVWLGLVLIGAAAITWSTFRAEALRELRVALVEPALFYLMVRACYKPLASRPGKRAWERWLLVDALVVSGATVAGLALFNFAQGKQIVIAEEGTKRLAGIYGSPNNLALFLGACIGLVIGVVLCGAALPKWRRGAYAAAGAVMFATAALAQSMGYLLLGLPASVVVALLLWRGRRALPIIAALVVVGLIVLVPLLQLPRFANVTDISTGTTFIRTLVWRGAWNLIREYPITGVGLDQFLYQYRSRYILPAGWTEPNLSHAHNYFLDHWARLGLVGLGLAVAMQAVFWRNGLRVYRRLREANPAVCAMAAGALCAMADFMGHGLVDTPFFVVDLALVFALLAALVTGPAEEEEAADT
jgi:O-antigen ligase